MRRKVYEREVIRLRARGEYLGTVKAADEGSALKTALKLVGLKKDEGDRLLLRRR